jgi:hypothetical protein
MTDKEGLEMKTAPYGAPEHDEWDEQEDAPLALPARPRRRINGPVTAVLLALLVGAICFYVGIRVEKSQLSSTASTTSTGTGSRLAAALAGRGTGAGTGAAAAGGGGLARAFGAGGAGGGNSSFGTISAVNGKTLFLTDVSGNTVKVTVSSATTVTKSLGVSTRSVHPGDTVVVSGLKGSDGTISATTVNDTGNRSAAGGSSSSGSGSGSASSAVSSLFGSGSGG